MNIRRLLHLVVGIVILNLVVQPSIARATEITVLCSNGFRAVMQELGPPFEQATGHKIQITYGVSTELKRRIEGGEVFDVAILSSAMIDDLIKQSKIARDSREVLARSGMGLAIKRGAAKPSIQTADALERTLKSSRSIAFAKEGAGGLFFMELIQRLGIAEEIKPKLKPTATGDEASQAVARGDAELGVLPMSEILPVPGVDLLGAFPDNVQSHLVIVAGVSSTVAAKASAAEELITHLTAPAALPVIRKKGMER